MSYLGKWIHRWERRLTLRDTNRRVFPFEWGLDWLSLNGEHQGRPLASFLERSEEYLRSGEPFSAAPLSDWRLEDERLTFPTPLPGSDTFNNQVYCRLFQAESDRAVIVVPQWNADSDSHVALCRILQRLGMTAVRLSLPYHEERRPPGMERADYMVSPNLGRTLYATRQAVLEVRQLAGWLKAQGYRKIGVMGTSIGSCVTYLAFVHDTSIHTGVFNHVSSFFADVVWTGLSTRYVRWGLEGHIELEDLRRCWAPISPYHYIHRLEGDTRPHRLITARYDLTFRPELTQKVFEKYEQHGIPLDRVELPCGHYTTGEFPFKYLDGWHICSYLYRRLSS